MVYHKYIKRGNKLHGPYTYRSVRVGDKIITEYIGKKEEKPRKSFSFLLIIPAIIIVFLVFFMLKFPFAPTGKVVLDVSPYYQINETITGNLKFNVRHGELIPADSIVKISLDGQEKEIPLSEIISFEEIEGSFYAEDTGLSGEGKGYGFIGEKKVYPDISFEILVSEEGEEVPEEEAPSEEEVPTEEQPEEEPSEEEEVPTEAPVEEAEEETEQPEEAPSEGAPAEEEPETEESPAPITGEAISELGKIEGKVSALREFQYDLGTGKRTEIVEGSVKVDGEEVSKDVLNLEIKDGKLGITTQYYKTEEGFGKDYLTEKIETIKINLEQFNFTAKQGALNIELVYNGETLLSLTEQIKVEGAEEPGEVEEVPENITEANVTEINITTNITIPANITEVNITIPGNITEPEINIIEPEINITIPENITEVNETEFEEIISNITLVNETVNVVINLSQYEAKVGNLVKWRKNIKLTEPGAIRIELPKLAENISVYIVRPEEEVTEEIEQEEERIEELTAPEEIAEEEAVVEEVLETEEGAKCSDSESEPQEFVKGTVTYNGKQYEDYCSDGKRLVDYYCSMYDEIKTKKYSCEFGCADGKCVEEKIEVKECTDSDEGLDYFKKGEVCTNGDCKTDFCIDGVYLSEGYCGGKTEKDSKIKQCEHGCENGACIKPEKREIETKIRISGEKIISTVKEVSKEEAEITGGITGEVLAEIELEGEPKFIIFFKKLFSKITGKTITTQETGEIKEVVIDENAMEYDIEYYTPAPVSTEEETERGKTIIVSGPDGILYTDVIANVYLPKEVDSSSVKMYHLVEGTRQEIQVSKYDLNNNSLIDYIEWNVPHLSEQTYELIIEISKAEHLDENKGFVSDIYEQVKALDDIWSEEIPAGHYVRVTFESELTSERDISVYPRVTGGTPRIEVYEVDGSEVIAEFTDLVSNEYNKVFLTGLQGSQDVFDLLVLDGSLEIDHIIDPITTYVPSSAGGQAWNGSSFSFPVTSLAKITQVAYTSAQLSIVATDDADYMAMKGKGGTDCSAKTLTANCNGLAEGVCPNYYKYNADGTYSVCEWVGEVSCEVAGFCTTYSGHQFLFNTTETVANINNISIRLSSTVVEIPVGGIYLYAWNYTSSTYIQLDTDTCYDGAPVRCNLTYVIKDPANFVNASGNLYIATQQSDTDATSLVYYVEAKVDYNEAGGDSNAPMVWLKSPPNNTKTTTTTPYFAANFTDDILLKNATPYLWNSTLNLINSTLTQTVVGVANTSNVSVNLPYDGVFYWNYYACDAANNCAFNNTNYTLTLDSTLPNINISYPLNNSNFSYNNVNVNYSVYDLSLQACWWSNSSGVVNNTITCGTNITTALWNEGSNVVVLWANDTFGNKNSTSVTFTVDTILPIITIVYPSNLSNHSVNTVDVNYTFTETNPGSCWWTNSSGVVNNTITCGANVTSAVWDEGSNVVVIWINDSAGNENSSSVNFTVDTTKPIFSNIQVTGVDYYVATISWNVNENANATLYYGRGIDTSSVETSSAMATYHSFSVGSLIEDTPYYFNVSGCDSFGNCNISKQYDFRTRSSSGPGRCSDECSSEDAENVCVNSTTLNSRSCGNYDGDSCLDWSDWSSTVCAHGCLNSTCVSPPRNISGAKLKVVMIEPPGDKQVNQNDVFDVLVEVTCEGGDCGEVEVALDPSPVLDPAPVSKIIKKINNLVASLINEVNNLVVSLVDKITMPSLNLVSAQLYQTISSCPASRLDKAGTLYELDSDISSTKNMCIDIRGNNITLDCKGHVLDGLGIRDTGIRVGYSKNIVIKNCIFKNWALEGLVVYRSERVTVQNIKLIDNKHDGIVLGSACINSVFENIVSENTVRYGISVSSRDNKNIKIRNVKSSGSRTGIYMAGTGNEIKNFESVGDDVGVYFNNGDDNIFTDSSVKGARVCSIKFYRADRNQIYNNVFNSNENFQLWGGAGVNVFNVAKTSGTNIIGGSYLGGNYWSNPAGNGSSDLCEDADLDGICDMKLVLLGNNIDYLPLTKPRIADTDAPQVGISYPEAVDYAGAVAELRYSVYDENLDSCWYSLDSGISNFSVVCGEGITGLLSVEGSNTWTIYANDSFRNLGFASVVFNVIGKCSSDEDCAKNKFCELGNCFIGEGVCVDVPGICAELVEPVCGCDGKTYANGCEGRKAGVSKDYDGECIFVPEPEAYWNDLEGKEISYANVSDTVKLVAKNIGNKNVRLEIWEDDGLFPDDQIRVIDAVGLEGIAEVEWKISYDDYRKAVDGELESDVEFYFKISIGNESSGSGITGSVIDNLFLTLLTGKAVDVESKKLYVSLKENTPPVAVIAKPVEGQRFNLNEEISFEQTSYDVDEEAFSCTWNFGDDIQVNMDDCQNGNCNTTHSYSSSGEKTVVLVVTDSRGLNNTAARKIRIGEAKGLVSTVAGDVPFYTTSENPVKINLLENEKRTVSWKVVASGTSSHEIFATAEIVGQPSSKVNSQSVFIDIIPPEYPVHCSNKIKDADETGVDCGGADCVACAVVPGCAVDGDCLGECAGYKAGAGTCADTICVYGEVVCDKRCGAVCIGDVDCSVGFTCNLENCNCTLIPEEQYDIEFEVYDEDYNLAEASTKIAGTQLEIADNVGTVIDTNTVTSAEDRKFTVLKNVVDKKVKIKQDTAGGKLVFDNTGFVSGTKVKSQFIRNYVGSQPAGKALVSVIAVDVPAGFSFGPARIMLPKSGSLDIIEICRCDNWDYTTASCGGISGKGKKVLVSWTCSPASSYQGFGQDDVYYWFEVSAFSAYGGVEVVPPFPPPICEDDECTSGQTRCVGDAKQTCSDYNNDGCTEWGGDFVCVDGCSGGVCKGPAPCIDLCNLGDARCVGSARQTCGNYNEDLCLEFGGDSACDYGCENGNCKLPPGPPTCDDTCSSLGKECGTWTICDKEKNCGSCAEGYQCESGVCVEMPIPCTDICTSLGYECGTWSICGEEVICGRCDDGKECNGGKCIIPAIPTCEENWQCSWTDCVKEGEKEYSTPYDCIDLNDCGTSANKPGRVECGITCLPRWDNCGEWSECMADFNLKLIIEGKEKFEGVERRVCKDSRGCSASSRIVKKKCELAVNITACKVEWCEEEYIEVREEETNKLVSRIKEVSLEKVNRIDIGFIVTDFTGYCDYCYDDVKNYDEIGVDCGGPNCPACVEVVEEKNVWKYVVYGLWLLLLLLIIAYVIYRLTRKKRVGKLEKKKGNLKAKEKLFRKIDELEKKKKAAFGL